MKSSEDVLVVGPLKGGGGVKPPEPLRKNHFYDLITNDQKTHETQEKLIKRILHAMFSSGQYQSAPRLMR